jgi:hypothetical protein
VRVPVGSVGMSMGMGMVCMTMMPVILVGLVRAICVVMMPMIPLGMMCVIRMAMIGVIMIVSMMPVIRMLSIGMDMLVSVIDRAIVFGVHRMKCPLMLKCPASEQYRKVLGKSAQRLCGAT